MSARSRRTAVLVLAILFAWVVGAGRARADVPGNDGWQPTVFLQAGSLGIGPELAVRVPGSAFGVRVGVHGFGFHDGDLADARFRHDEPAYGYDASLRLGGEVRLLNGGITADYFPLGSGLRLSAGLVINGDEVTAHGSPIGQMRIGPVPLVGESPGSVEARATFNAVAPTVGFGWSGALSQRWRLEADTGALFEGTPHLSERAEGPMMLLPSVPVDVERERRRLHRLADYPVLPLAMLGLGWSF